MFLRDRELLAKKSWRDFSARFFNEYQSVILSYFGYSSEVLSAPRVGLNNRELFFAAISALAHRDVFRGNRDELVRVLHDSFDLHLELSTIKQYICENNSEYEDYLSLLTSKKSCGIKK